MQKPVLRVIDSNSDNILLILCLTLSFFMLFILHNHIKWRYQQNDCHSKSIDLNEYLNQFFFPHHFELSSVTFFVVSWGLVTLLIYGQSPMKKCFYQTLESISMQWNKQKIEHSERDCRKCIRCVRISEEIIEIVNGFEMSWI